MSDLSETINIYWCVTTMELTNKLINRLDVEGDYINQDRPDRFIG